MIRETFGCYCCIGIDPNALWGSLFMARTMVIVSARGYECLCLQGKSHKTNKVIQ